MNSLSDAIKEAESTIAITGRELGGGPFEAVKRIVPGLSWTRYTERLKFWQELPDRLKQHYASNEDEIMERANSYAHGVAVGLVAADNFDTLVIIEEIHDEWGKEYNGQ